MSLQDEAQQGYYYLQYLDDCASAVRVFSTKY